MDFYEVSQIGRESVKSVNATILASLIRQLVNKCEQHKGKSQNYKFYIRCKEKLEMVQRKLGEDEGFESDANEEESLLSESEPRTATSPCFTVDDHVFRLGKEPSSYAFTKDSDSPASIVGSSDSANSSGASDTDDVDVVHSPQSAEGKFKAGSEGNPKKRLERVPNYRREEYPIADVIFCHTDPRYPTVIAWVIKKKTRAECDVSSRLGKTGVESISKSDNCLDVIVCKCKSHDALMDLCSSYREFSKRIKLDQYKSVNRKRDADDSKKSVSLACLLDHAGKEGKVSLSDMKIANSGLIKASELSMLNPKIVTSFSRTEMKNSASLSSLIKSEATKGRLAEASDGDPPRKSNSLLNLSKSNVLKDISSGLNDHFNLVQRTDTNGITHIEVSKGADASKINPDRYKSKIRKEIEGVILTDADSYAKKEHVRQRQSPGVVGAVGKLSWRADENATDEAPPPVRPERRKFIKKKGLAPSPPASTRFDHKPAATPRLYASPRDGVEKIVKGQYIRVQSWGNQNNPCEGNLGSWKGVGVGAGGERLPRKSDDKYGEKRRSKSATRTGKRAATPMAYRYIDITDESYYPNSASRTLCGLSQKVRELGGGIASGGNARRRRNSFDDVMHFENRSKGNLKSVIKKNKKMSDKTCEPKKVTFSAFATVQVVD